jgi:hypothetical protein
MSSTASPHRSNERAAADQHALPNPVVVIPGVLGSKLVADSDAAAVWGEWRPGFRDPGSDSGAQLFGLPMQIGTPLDQLRSSTHVAGTLALARGSVAGVPVEISVYSDAMSALGVESQVATFSGGRGSGPGPGGEAFEYSYDWRRSLDESAVDFEAFLQRATRFLQVQRKSGEPIRFNVVAHSMGGLLLRYFLQFGSQLLPYDGAGPRLNWAGAAYIDKAIIVGTPNAGSCRMVERLVKGIPGNPLHPTYGPVLVGSMPSGYMLLPRRRHQVYAGGDADLLDPDFWLARDWGIAASWLEEDRARYLSGVASANERRAIAEDHLRKCLANARVFQEAMDRPIGALPPSLELHLILGDTTKTPAQFAGERGDRGIRWARFAAGDGTVLASSARLDETGGRSPIPWHSITTSGAGHMGLLKDRDVLGRVVAMHAKR